MKLKNTKTNKEHVIIGFLCISKQNKINFFDIRELEDYILENEDNDTRS